MAAVRWLGAAGLEFKDGVHLLLVDPYLSRPSKWRSLTRPLEPDREAIRQYLGRMSGSLAGVLVGHTHSDHVLDVPEILRATPSRAYGTRSLANLLSAYGLEERAVVVEKEAAYRLGPFEARAILSRHGRAFLGRIPFPGEIGRGLKPPLRIHRYRHGEPLVWLIAASGRRYLHVGSADFIAERLENVRADVLFACAAGRQYTPGFIRNLLERVRPEVVIPFHFDDFTAPLEPGRPVRHLPGVKLERFAREIREADPAVEVVVPEPFVPMEL